jgi:hypothetical protein
MSAGEDDQKGKDGEAPKLSFDISKIKAMKPRPAVDPDDLRRRSEETARALGIKLIDTMPAAPSATAPSRPRPVEASTGPAAPQSKAKAADRRHRVPVPPDLYRTLLHAEVDEGRSRQTIVADALTLYWASPAAPRSTSVIGASAAETGGKKQLARISLPSEIYRKLRHAEIDEGRTRREIIGDALRFYWGSSNYVYV